MEGKCVLQQQVLFAKTDADQDQSKIFYKMFKAKFQDGTPTKVLIPIVRSTPARSILRAIAPAQPIFRTSAFPQGLNNMFAPPSIQGNPGVTTAGNVVIVNEPCRFISQPQPSAMPLPVGTTTISHVPPGTIFFSVSAPTAIAHEPMNQNILTAQVGQNLPMGFVIAKSLPTPTVVSGAAQGRLELPAAVVAPEPIAADDGTDWKPHVDPSIPEVVIKMGEGEVWLPSDSPAKSIPRGGTRKKAAATPAERTKKWRSLRRGARLSAPHSLRDCYVVLDRIDMSYLRDGSVNLSEVTDEQLLGARKPSPPASGAGANATSDKVAGQPGRECSPNVSGQIASQVRAEDLRTQIERLKTLLVAKLAEEIERLSLSKAERVEIILLYGRKNWSQRMVVDHFNKTHPNRPNITPSTVSRLFQKFKNTGSVMDKVRSGRPKCVTEKSNR